MEKDLTRKFVRKENTEQKTQKMKKCRHWNKSYVHEHPIKVPNRHPMNIQTRTASQNGKNISYTGAIPHARFNAFQIVQNGTPELSRNFPEILEIRIKTLKI